VFPDATTGYVVIVFMAGAAFPCAQSNSRGSAPVARTHAVAGLFPHNSSTVSATKRNFAF
jgi:hypothetical protein